MYVLTINKTEYKSVERWDELTIDKAISLHKLIDKMPKKLKDLYGALSKKDNEKAIDKINKIIGDQEKKKDFPAFYGKVLKLVSNIPQKIIDRVDWNYRTEMYYFKIGKGVSCESIVLGLLSFPYDYTIKKIKSFEFKGERLVLPYTKEVMGREVPMYGEQALTFSESADMELFSAKLEAGKYTWAKNIVSILCRPKGEEYDEETSLRRAEKMGSLTMDIVWEVFFCYIKCLNTSNRNTLISLLRSGLSKKKQHLAAA